MKKQGISPAFSIPQNRLFHSFVFDDFHCDIFKMYELPDLILSILPSFSM